jgi:hypothetical protein
MEPDRAYANKCAQAVLCLREYFPQDIIGLIFGICWDLRSMPVFAFLTNNTYTWVARDNWEILKRHIFKLHPQLRLRHMNCKSLRICRRSGPYFPYKYDYMNLLIPGWVWDEMMIDGIDNEVISCDFIDIDVATEEYPPKSSSCATMYRDPLTSISNIMWIAISPKCPLLGEDCSTQVNSFMNIQGRVAF